jgi:chemotaxis protein CheY-P-specific phosphatase CheC
MRILKKEHAMAIQELINIGFERATSVLAHVLHSGLELSVPYVATINSSEIIDFLIKDFKNQYRVNLIQQSFYGNFLGEAALILAANSSQTLVKMLCHDLGYPSGLETDKMEQEALLEIGNLVIGTSLVQFAEILNTRVSFKAPQILLEDLHSEIFHKRVSEKKESALMIRTSFQMTSENVSGYLFFFLSSKCQEWIIDAVDEYLEQQ